MHDQIVAPGDQMRRPHFRNFGHLGHEAVDGTKVVVDNTYCTPEERRAHLISEGLVRISTGLEDLDDLIADIGQALGQA
jgi:cystathionine beta-lyase/cystathionine gamma-synthase